MNLQADHLGVRADRGWRLRDVSLTLMPGRLCAVLGGNGAGKSTLLHALAGDLRPDAGSATLDGQPLHRWSARDLARRRAVLTQHDGIGFDLTVAEVVALGRLPWAARRSAADAPLIHDVLAGVQAAALAARPYPALSGGERARVRLARTLAQVWQRRDVYLLLDEPMAHLDFAVQHRCMAQLRACAVAGQGVLLVLHDPNLAAAYADDVLLLRDGQVIAAGPVEATLDADRLSALYGTPVRLLQDADGQRHFHTLAQR